MGKIREGGLTMLECERIESIAHAWEEGGSISSADFELIWSHCSGCAACAGRHGTILPLLERDARGTPVPGFGNPVPGFSDAVMQRIRAAAPRRVLPRLSWAALAAACLVFLAGIGITALWLSSGGRADEVVVHFQLAAPGARSVALVGSFTGWDTSKLRMSDPNGDGVWQITIRLKRDSVNIYDFIIDGTRWVPDPQAPAQVDDGFGGLSSVLQL